MDYVIAEGVRSLKDDGRAVLLDLQSGAYFALNAVGTEVWDGIARGEARDASIDRLEKRFRVDRRRIAGDVDALIEQLAGKRLIVPRRAAPRKASAPAAAPLGRIKAFVQGAAALAGMDVLLKVAGFERFHSVMRRLPAPRSAAPDKARAAAVVAGVDAAAGLYFKRAWCLQRSAAAACLLRLHGFPAELVIGVRRMPFMAHAWVEVDGAVVNDDPRVRDGCTPIERC